jgi:hypothetical protein
MTYFRLGSPSVWRNGEETFVMIPQKVKDYLAKDGGDVLRQNKQGALRTLSQLGVDPNSEFGEFYLEYQGAFISPRPIAELLDIDDSAIPAVPDQTDYSQDRYQLPEKFLALTSDESEGMYLCNKDDQAVYDFNLKEYEIFMSGEIPARWKSFNSFLAWYFDSTDPAAFE